MYMAQVLFIIIDDYKYYTLVKFWILILSVFSYVFLSSIQLESEVNVDVLRDLLPHIATAKMCVDRVFRSTTAVSEVGNKTSSL